MCCFVEPLFCPFLTFPVTGNHTGKTVHHLIPPHEILICVCVCVCVLSLKETREADHLSAYLHEVSAQQTEAEAAGHPEGESVRLRPGGTPAQLRTGW